MSRGLLIFMLLLAALAVYSFLPPRPSNLLGAGTPASTLQANSARSAGPPAMVAAAMPQAIASLDLAPAVQALAAANALTAEPLSRILASAGNAAPDVKDRQPGDTQRELSPEEILPRLLATTDGFFRDQIATDLTTALSFSREADPIRHRELSLAALLASEIVLQDPAIPAREKSSFGYITGFAVFGNDPVLREYVLTRFTQMIPLPAEPDASYAVLLENQLKFYSEQGDQAAFTAIVPVWQQVAWPQGEAYREWREGKLERMWGGARAMR